MQFIHTYTYIQEALIIFLLSLSSFPLSLVYYSYSLATASHLLHLASPLPRFSPSTILLPYFSLLHTPHSITTTLPLAATPTHRLASYLHILPLHCISMSLHTSHFVIIFAIFHFRKRTFNHFI